MGEQQLKTVEAEHPRANGFDPSRYLTKLSRRMRTADGQWKTVELDYMEVKWRLLWLRTEHPEARIETHLEKHEDDLAIFSAKVTLPGGAEATGWGSETAGDWKDFIEKAETKALGRALAALGFGTQFCEDFDFAQGSEEKVVDAPVDIRATRAGTQRAAAEQPASQRMQAVAAGRRTQEAPAQQANGGWQDRPATEPQIKAIYAIARGAQAMDDGTLEEFCRSRYGCVPAELSRRQASELIDTLKLGAAS
ncbi:MAG TPA: hypothetical protein VFA70_01735 [Dehalococcoidia bacterium]|nr:hypothetical protein [Dehalococcoidia bacterium]